MIDNKTQKLKEVIISLSKELNSSNLTYCIDFWFGCSVSVKIGGIELNQNPKYGFFGLNNGVGESDLIELEKDGFLKKISEIIDENDPLEKRIEYEIIKAV
ncbi:TPA: hypothetical protein ACGFUW_002510 [Flavobacterium psychrophilum]|uniref:hypothetical protein n=1 Tax=Flavobacterium psychrophilum TaxID=96345 RepID=UPI0029D58284|nr:hypothetical protein [Flavobacterium psychrophilum]EKT4510655.1 hypothetical protein [Flavobacterium psychrophilum]ELY1979785.1 hypothetical protein [Flavobacterium psychrophilum]MEB3380552.1 hypothetical protein [Flavobacterium psychrophilum]